MRALLRVAFDCDNSCAFCGQADAVVASHDGSDARCLADRLSQLRASAEELTLVGGEPMLHPDLAAVVRAARHCGFTRVGIQTNGLSLTSSRLTELVEAGLTDLQLSLHGRTAAIHDYHTGTPGSFDKVKGAIRMGTGHGLAVAVSTVLTRSNFRVLGELPALLARHNVNGWCVWVPHARGRADTRFDRVVPRLGLAIPFALHALASADRFGLPSWIAGAPLCTLGPMATRAMETPPRAFPTTCDPCPARASCPGLDAHYLARFDGDELHPGDAPGPDGRSGDIARLFVGPGRLTAARDISIPAPPRVARARLPVIGKSMPAVAEVRRGDRQTGDALGELFPALFEDTTD